MSRPHSIQPLCAVCDEFVARGGAYCSETCRRAEDGVGRSGVKNLQECVELFWRQVRLGLMPQIAAALTDPGLARDSKYVVVFDGEVDPLSIDAGGAKPTYRFMSPQEVLAAWGQKAAMLKTYMRNGRIKDGGTLLGMARIRYSSIVHCSAVALCSLRTGGLA